MTSQHDGEHEDFAETEQQLIDVLRVGYGIEPRVLDLPPGEQAGVDGRAAETLASILGSPTEPAVHGATHLPVVTWRRSFAALASAAAVVLLIGIGLAIWPLGGDKAVYAATPPLLRISSIDDADFPLAGVPADAHLEQLAERAGAHPEASGSGEVQWIRAAGWWLDTDNESGTPKSRVTPVIMDTYRLPGGGTRIVTAKGTPLDPDGAVASAQEPDSGVRTDETFPPGPDDALASPDLLPRNPAELRALILGTTGECAGIEGTCIVNAIQTFGLNSVPSADLRAALLRALIGANDMVYVGTAQDRRDQTSEVFAITDPDGFQQRFFLFDTRTGKYSGDETVLIQDSTALDVNAPAVIEFNTVLTREWISTKELPRRESATR
ncbi:hypothetical protein [Nocardioides limicola]|uniref:hypothetical protein n=1 Tax=Nocardioides limicola TaxID=2803368 RepID=UPI00193B8112|nr:hypothetical protein [Nocardioides sp. DJM-14]